MTTTTKYQPNKNNHLSLRRKSWTCGRYRKNRLKARSLGFIKNEEK